MQWQKLQWQAETAPAKHQKQAEPYTLPPAEAVLRILAGLEAGLWSDAAALAVPLEIFCGLQVDAAMVCESGWRWGFLARQEAESRMWYRLAPPAAADAPPDRYLAVRGDEGVAVDLDAVPFDALASTKARMSNEQPGEVARQWSFGDVFMGSSEQAGVWAEIVALNLTVVVKALEGDLKDFDTPDKRRVMADGLRESIATRPTRLEFRQAALALVTRLVRDDQSGI